MIFYFMFAMGCRQADIVATVSLPDTVARANRKSQSFTITCVDLYQGGSGAGKSIVAKLQNYL